MNTPSKRRKLLTSIPGLFFTALAIHTLLQLVLHNGKISLAQTVVWGIPIAFLFTLLTRRNIKKLEKTTGLTEPGEQAQLHKAVATGVLPTDAKILAALPAYLDKREKTNVRARKEAVPIMIFMVVIFGLTVVMTQNIIFALVAIAILSLLFKNYQWTKAQSLHIASLRKQLTLNK